MKVGIITFHRAINYGAVLQAYALQQILTNMGYDAEIVDYRCNKIERAYSFVEKLKQAKSLKYVVYLILKRLFPGLKKKRFINKFVKKNLKMSEEYTFQTIKNTNNKYDLFITGSDQVWNYNHTGFDDTYFLKFVEQKSKKKSYAASFGFNKLNTEVHDKYKELLKDFSIISVRENSGTEIIKQLLPEKKAIVSADPTFLLTKQQWERLCDFEKNNLGSYVLIYELIRSDSLREFACGIAKEKNYKVICISDEWDNKDNVKFLYGASPEEFLWLIKNAKAVCTNSFHGTAFSINFNTPVCVELLKAGMASLNTRILELLETFSINDRIINDKIEPFSMKWEHINRVKETMSKEGVDYLKSICH